MENQKGQDKKLLMLEIGLRARRSRHPYIRELGNAMLSVGVPARLATLHEKPGSLMPSQMRLIAEIKQVFDIEEYLATN